MMIYHPCRDEITAEGEFVPGEAYGILKALALQAGVRMYSLAELYGSSIRKGISPFRDNSHPNAAGQKLLSELMLEIFETDDLPSQWEMRTGPQADAVKE